MIPLKKYSGKLVSAVLVVLVLIPLLNTCERFAPSRELYIYTDSISILSGGIVEFSGAILNVGKDNITQHGFCWSESRNPSVEGNFRNELGAKSNAGKFTATVSGLKGNTIYYVRAYATSSAGTEYGKEKSFTTPVLKLPVVTTAAATSITQNEAISGGTVADDGGSEVTGRGVCWDTLASPTIDKNRTTDGNGVGSFTSKLSGLSCGTTYYVRAYATNDSGTAYGNQVDFTTVECDPGLPLVQTGEVSEKTASSATCGGVVVDEGESPVVARGICWSTSQGPTIENDHTTEGSGEGSFVSTLSPLDQSTTYYARAYATNGDGTSYGEEITFKTWQGILIDLDGNTYNTIKIGEQVWMAENLRVTQYTDGTAINLVEAGFIWSNLGSAYKAYCWYDNNESRGDDYGALYNWYAVMNGSASNDDNPGTIQGVCPEGWHLPSDSEWKEMEMFLGMSQAEADETGGRGTDEGGKLKETDTIFWSIPNTGATNESGFDALPGGGRSSLGGLFSNLGTHANFWVSTQLDQDEAFSRRLEYNSAIISRIATDKKAGFSVRCVEGTGYTLPKVTTSPVTGIGQTSAQSGGNVTDNGGDIVSARGVCWSTEQDPTLADNITMDGTGTGTFASILSGLERGTAYYVRAYATNSAGTAYGEMLNFTTLDLPQVTTDSVYDITTSSATVAGSVAYEGGDPVTARGICWSLSPNPTTADFTTSEGNGSGSFSSPLSGLSLFTTYYVRAYATNGVGTAYGAEMEFKTLWDGSPVTDIDGNVYPTVGIGDQVWMAHNLAVTRYADGTSIPLIENTSEWAALGYGDMAYCIYENLPGNKPNVGALYTWATAARGDSSAANPSGLQGVCPDGWHLPSDEEWKELEASLGMDPAEIDLESWHGTDEGGKLKEAGTDYWGPINTGGTNESGFTGRGAGVRNYSGLFQYYGQVCAMWSSTSRGNNYAWMRAIQYDETRINRNGYTKSSGYSVRCVKDMP